MRLDFGEGVFNRVEVRAVRWKVEQRRANGFNGLADLVTFVTGQVVHDDNVTGLQAKNKNLLDIGHKRLTIDWSIKDQGCHQAGEPQSRHEGRGFPVPVRNADLEPLTFLDSSALPCHAG